MKKILVFLCAILLVLAAVQANAASITITPDPLYGYIELSYFTTPLLGFGDDTYQNISTSSFEWAGETWNSIGLVSNGYLVVGGATDADVQFINSNLPNSAAPNNILAPFWTDLNPAAGGNIYHTALTDGVDTWEVFEWENVPNWGDGEENTFQVWIRTTGSTNSSENIHFIYDEVSDGNAGFLTVGAEDKTGTVGNAYYFNGLGTLPTQGTQLLVSSSDLPLPVPEPTTLLLLGTGLVGLVGFRRKFKS